LWCAGLDPEHGRVLQAYPTLKGEELLSGAHRLVEAVEERMLDGVSKNDRRLHLEALRGCADSLAAGGRD
jgi:hypothetical protein